MALKSNDRSLKEAALSLYSITSDGFLPKVDRYVKSKSFSKKITTATNYYLGLRNSIEAKGFHHNCLSKLLMNSSF